MSFSDFSLRRNWLAILLLTLASIHCAQCIFFDNYSYIDLVAYENGHEKMPYQGRVGMMPFLKMAHSNHFLIEIGNRLVQQTGSTHLTIEQYSPEKVVSYAAGVLSIFWMVVLCSLYGLRRFPKVWWFTPALFLAVLYVAYAARADQNVWYPYDLPHSALFSTGLFALFAGNFGLIAFAFVLDCPMRETSIYLVPCILSIGYARKEMKSYGFLAGVLFAVWLPIHLLITHHFSGNPSETGLHYQYDYHALSQPKHLPQVASFVGFLALPILVCRSMLGTLERALLVGALPGIALSALFGIWFETRVWSEWNMIAACLGSSIFFEYIAVNGLTRQGVPRLSFKS